MSASVQGAHGRMTYPPLDEPKRVAEDVWIVDGPVIEMSFPGGKLPFPTRMVVVRLPSGRLWLWSPIRASEACVSAVSALGEVAHLVSPNAIHYAHVAAWKRRFPGATAWASPGVEARAASNGIETDFDRSLPETPPPAWEDVLALVRVEGSRVMEEYAFLHRPSRTAILADLIENFEADKVPPRLRWLLRLVGVMAPDGMMPLDYRLTFFGRKHRARPGLRAIVAWDPERVIVAHGKWFERDGATQLRRAFRWAL